MLNLACPHVCTRIKLLSIVCGESGWLWGMFLGLFRILKMVIYIKIYEEIPIFLLFSVQNSYFLGPWIPICLFFLPFLLLDALQLPFNSYCDRCYILFYHTMWLAHSFYHRTNLVKPKTTKTAIYLNCQLLSASGDFPYWHKTAVLYKHSIGTFEATICNGFPPDIIWLYGNDYCHVFNTTKILWHKVLKDHRVR